MMRCRILAAAAVLILTGLLPAAAGAGTTLAALDPADYKCRVVAAGPPERLECAGVPPREKEVPGWKYEPKVIGGSSGIGDTMPTPSTTLHIYTAPDGRVYTFLNAPPPPSLLTGSCWSCEVVGRFAQLMDAFAKQCYEALRPDAFALVQYLFAIWLLHAGTRLVFPSFGQAGAVLKDIVLRSCLFMIVTFLLSEAGRSVFFDAVYEPALAVPATFANALLATVASIGGLEVPDRAVAPFTALTTITVPAGYAALPLAAINEVVYEVKAMHGINGAGVEISATLLTQFSPLSFNFGTVLGGALMLLIFGVAWLSFPFYFIDFMFKIGLMAALAPILIPAALFGPSRNWATSGLASIVQAAGSFIASAVIYGIGGALMVAAARSQPATDVPAYVAKIKANPGDFGLASPSIWLVAFAGIFMILAMSRVLQLVGSIVGSDDTSGIGSAAQGMAGAAARGVAGVAQGAAGAYGAGVARQGAALIKGRFGAGAVS